MYLVKLNSIKLLFLNGVSDLAHQGIIPMGTERNHKFVSRFSDFSDQLSSAQQMMIADAQTSGGLLIALPPNKQMTSLSNLI